MNWTPHVTGIREIHITDGWFVQRLLNGLWISGPLPASPHSWAAAELLYVSREDAMRAVEQRQHKAAAWLAQDAASRTCSDALAEAHDRSERR